MDKDLDYLQQLTNIEEKIKVKRNELHQLIKSDNSTDKTLSIMVKLTPRSVIDKFPGSLVA